MIQRSKAFFLSLSLPAKVLMAGVATVVLSWAPILLYLVFVYGLLGVKDGNPIGLGLLMVFGSVLGGAIAMIGLILLLASKIKRASS
ncbi:hypothetical protein [Luteimonas lutimaris]|uniref:Uncharacterized protein n=1 Tax=Luteimonas lutimaris TaxID=698645 RepID=A0ABP7MVE0_9GAMM